MAVIKQLRQKHLFLAVIALFLTASGTLLSSCSSTHGGPDVSLAGHKEQIRYYDRDGDGKVDLEYHRYPGVADADWELRDDNYDGRYEKKILYGIGVIESSIDLPVPTNVTISPNPSH